MGWVGSVSGCGVVDRWRSWDAGVKHPQSAPAAALPCLLAPIARQILGSTSSHTALLQLKAASFSRRRGWAKLLCASKPVGRNRGWVVAIQWPSTTPERVAVGFRCAARGPDDRIDRAGLTDQPSSCSWGRATWGASSSILRCRGQVGDPSRPAASRLSRLSPVAPRELSNCFYSITPSLGRRERPASAVPPVVVVVRSFVQHRAMVDGLRVGTGPERSVGIETERPPTNQCAAPRLVG